MHTATDPVAGLQDRDVDAARRETGGGREPGEPGAHHDDVHAGRHSIFFATAAGVGAAMKSSNDSSAP